jgi:hypothetical protein
VHAAHEPARKNRLPPLRQQRAGLSKLNSVRNIEVDVILGEPACPDGLLAVKPSMAIKGTGAYRSTRAPDSLERR